MFVFRDALEEVSWKVILARAKWLQVFRSWKVTGRMYTIAIKQVSLIAISNIIKFTPLSLHLTNLFSTNLLFSNLTQKCVKQNTIIYIK